MTTGTHVLTGSDFRVHWAALHRGAEPELREGLKERPMVQQNGLLRATNTKDKKPRDTLCAGRTNGNVAICQRGWRQWPKPFGC